MQPLAEEVAGTEHRDYRFFAGTTNHRQFHAAFLHVHTVSAG
jgi:hypothetical protein